MLVLIKRPNGEASIQEVIHFEDGSHAEGGDQLGPDDVVDGKRIADWPAGVHTVKTVERTGRGTDWTANSVEIEHEEA